MRIYSHKDDEKYFFSPYLTVSYIDGRLSLYQRLFGTHVSIKCASEAADQLCRALSAGVDEAELLSLLTRTTGLREEASDYMTAMLQMGVLE